MTLTPINQSIYKFWHIKDNLYNSLLITYALIIFFLFVAVKPYTFTRWQEFHS